MQHHDSQDTRALIDRAGKDGRRGLRFRRGWTLLDVTVTVLIIGVLSAIVTPRFLDAVDRHRAKAAAERIKADLSWARQEAMSRSSGITVQFIPNATRYEIPQLVDPNHSGQSYAVDLSADPYGSSRVTALLGNDSLVQFDRFGQPDSGGTVTVQAGAFQQTVTLVPIRGVATIP